MSMFSREWPIDSLDHFNFDADVVGRRDVKGGCPDVGDFSVGGQMYHGWLETAAVWGSVLKQTAVWSPTTKEIFLKDGGVGHYESESFSTPHTVSVWDKMNSEVCEDNVGLIFEGTGTLFSIGQEEEKQKEVLIVQVPEKSLFFSLNLKTPLGVCGTHGFSTQFPDISVVTFREFDKPLHLKKIGGQDVSVHENILATMGYNNLMSAKKIQDAFNKFSVQLCEQERKSLVQHQNMIRNHPSEAMLDLDGEKGFMAQTRGAVVHIIKCTPVQASYRHIDEDTKEIPVTYNGRDMFVDPVSMVLKPNATVVKSGVFTPVMWKIGGIWFCKNKKRTKCNEPLKFMPGNGDMAKYTLGYEDLPLEDGTFTDYDLAEHEEAIFHEESKQKVLDGLGEDIINLRPLRIASKSFVDQILDFFFKEVSPHSTLMLIMTLVFLLDNVIGWMGRMFHVYDARLKFWKYFLTPFNQIFLFSFLPWKKLIQLGRGNHAELAEVYKTFVRDDNHYVAVDMKNAE